MLYTSYTYTNQTDHINITILKYFYSFEYNHQNNNIHNILHLEYKTEYMSIFNNDQPEYSSPDTQTLTKSLTLDVSPAMKFSAVDFAVFPQN